MATRAPPVVAKKLVDWQLGLKIVGSVKPDLKKPVQDAITKNSELQRQILEAKESRPKFYWDHYEAILTAPSDQEFLKSSIQGIKDFYPEPLDTKVQATTLASNAASLRGEADAQARQVEVDIAKLQQRLDSITSIKPLDQITVNEIFERYPEAKEEADERIRRDFWAHHITLAEHDAALKAPKDHH